MKRNHLILAAAIAVALSAAGYGLYRLGMAQATQAAPPSPMSSAASDRVDPKTGRRVLYWRDPMVPGAKFDKPGKSPFMDMQLVPVYADEAADAGGMNIDPRVRQNLGLRTAQATRGRLAPTLDAVGSVAWDERELALVQARANGYVERLFVHAPFEAVRPGQPLAELYVPDWIAAQEDYLAVRRMGTAAPPGLLDGARQRMRLAGMPDAQITLVESSDSVHPRVTVSAPIAGVISELAAREGMTVTAGASLFRINGLASVWVYAEVPEARAAALRPGGVVEARAPAFPGMIFKGKVSALLPEVNPTTRTLKARIELANPKGQLVPGMFVNLGFVDLTPHENKEAVLVPSEAVIQTGTRSLVIVVDGDGFVPTEVEVGIEARGQTEIRKGLEAGQKVVVSGQFLLDSEASLKGSARRMGDAAAASGHQHPTQGGQP